MSDKRAPRVHFFFNADESPSPEEVELIAPMYGDAEKARQVAIAAVAAYRHLRAERIAEGRAGDRRELERTAKREAKQKREADALAMLEDGASYGEVALTFGWSRTTVGRKFPGYGWSSSEGGQLGMALRHSSMQRPTRLR